MKIWIATLFLAGSLAGCTKWNERGRGDKVSGTIEMDETRIASRYGGRVQAILAAEGDSLAPGQAIVFLDAAELQSKLTQALANLQEIQAGPRVQELVTVSNEWEAALAELDFARTEAARTEQLFRDQAIPAVERDRALTRANALERSAAAARSRYDLLLAGSRTERIDHAKSLVREIETHLGEMKLTAPTNAVLEVLHVKIGDVAAPNQPVATLLLTNHLWLRVYVPEPWLGLIQPGQSVPVTVDGFPERQFEGTIEQIARVAEFTPRNVQTVEDRVRQVFGVKIALPADTGRLRAGMSADVIFPTVPGRE